MYFHDALHSPQPLLIAFRRISGDIRGLSGSSFRDIDGAFRLLSCTNSYSSSSFFVPPFSLLLLRLSSSVIHYFLLLSFLHVSFPECSLLRMAFPRFCRSDRGRAVERAAVITCVVVVLCFFFSCGTSFNKATGSMVSYFLRCLSPLTFTKSEMFAFGICLIPPSVPQQSGDRTMLEKERLIRSVTIRRPRVCTPIPSNTLVMSRD